jgi:monovalent cation:proton antiporter-2 (CPA2) family protein
MATFLGDALLFFVAAIVIVPVCKRLGMSAVLGYLAAGLVIGPPLLGLLGNADDVLHFAEIGIVLLLFLIGLELQPKRLWLMRHAVFGLGTLQVLATTAVLGGIFWLAGLGTVTSLIIAFAMALSSTAFVLQLLGERRKLNSAHGRAAFGVLLLQDIAVIPVLAAVSVASATGPAESERVLDPWWLLAVVVGAVAARYLLRPFFRVIAATSIQELFTAAGLALVIGAAVAMGAAGLSMGLGAFIAGMLVADSPYRHQIESDVNPFKGLLLGLFFIAVGMSVDLDLLFADPLLVVGLTGGLMIVKASILFPLARWHGLDNREAVRASLVLAQGGEFAFVLLTASAAGGLIPDGAADLAVLVVILSMAATPLLVSLGERFLAESETTREYDTIAETQQRHVVIAGFGRVGQIVARVLTMRRISFTGLEINPHQVDFVRKYGHEIYYGDATRLDLLEAARLSEASALVVAVGNVEASLKIVEEVRETFPQVTILARAVDRDHEIMLRELGVHFVMRDTLLSSLGLATELLQHIGLPAAAARAAVERFREHDAATLLKQFEVFRDADALDRAIRDAQAELLELFSEDARAAAEIDAANPDSPERAHAHAIPGSLRRAREARSS